MLKDFTRGGQTTMHSVRMFVQSFKYISWISLILFGTIFCISLVHKTQAFDRYICLKYFEAKLSMMVASDDHPVTIKSPNGTITKVRAKNFVNHYLTKLALIKVQKQLKSSILLSVYSCIGAFLFLSLMFTVRGQGHRSKRDLRGAQKSTAKELRRILRRRRQASDLKVAGVPLKKDAETQNMSIVGTTGVGKTTAMIELMKQTRARKQKAVVYDKKGCFVEQFYRPGKDIVLNPLDARSPAWNVWADCKDGADFETLAEALIPDRAVNSDPFWISAARTILSSTCQRLKKQNKTSMRNLLNPIFTDSEDGLAELLKGTVAETLVSEKIDKTALSIKATLSTYCKSLMFLRGLDEKDEQIFSIRDWMANVDDDSWIFLSVVDALKMEMLRPLISVWLDIAARSLLSLPLDRNRRIWMYYDELGTAHKLPSLEMLLAEGREYGSCNVVSFLEKAQIVEKYGVNPSSTILSLMNTNILFRTNSNDTARWMSGILGTREIIDRRESLSMGANQIRDGVSINEERRVEPLVLDTEFLTLPDMHAYLKLPGDLPRAPITFEYSALQKTQPALVRREDVDLCDVESFVSDYKTALSIKNASQQEIVQAETDALQNDGDDKLIDENETMQLSEII